jgi:hypothetical protein
MKCDGKGKPKRASQGGLSAFLRIVGLTLRPYFNRPRTNFRSSSIFEEELQQILADVAEIKLIAILVSLSWSLEASQEVFSRPRVRRAILALCAS